MTLRRWGVVPFFLAMGILQLAVIPNHLIDYAISFHQTKLNPRSDKIRSRMMNQSDDIHIQQGGNLTVYFGTKLLTQNNQRIHCNESDCWDPIGVSGKWVYSPNRTFLTNSGCCNPEFQVRLDGSTKPINCSKEQYPLYFQGDNKTYQQMGGYECQCRGFVDHYIWQSPYLPEFDPHRTCNLLGKRTVLMIGDSTMRQTASYLINMLFPAGCQTQLQYRMSDTLIKKNFGSFNRGGHWRDSVIQTRPLPDIVILSVGPHIKQCGSDDETTLYRRVVDEVLDGITQMKQSNPELQNTTFVWKTQQPSGCSKSIFLMPPEEAAQQTNSTGMFLSSGHVSYSWDLYLISRLQQLEMPYLDLRMLYSRSDAHPASHYDSFGRRSDCLHFCNGPLDVVASLFQKLLLDLP